MNSQNQIYPEHTFLNEVEARGPFEAAACFQCRKCTNGCPVAFAMDLMPDEVIRLVILGQRAQVLSCCTIWICAACETCTTRCPNRIKIAELMDCLKEMALAAKIPSPQPQVLKLHQAFLKNMQKRGRMFETTFMLSYLFSSRRPLGRGGGWLGPAEMKLGTRLALRGRLPFRPQRIKDKASVRRIMARSRQRRKRI